MFSKPLCTLIDRFYMITKVRHFLFQLGKFLSAPLQICARLPMVESVFVSNVSPCGRCPLMGGVLLWVVSSCGRCLPLMGGVLLWVVSSYGRCCVLGGVLLWKVSSYGWCCHMGGVLLWKVSSCGRHRRLGQGGRGGGSLHSCQRE